MKRIMKMAAFVLVLVLGSSLRNDLSAQYRGDVSYQTFYDELSPHGQWVDYPSHGYVWVPNAGRDFRPYATNGHWVWSADYEWMWVSDYDWGWAPFHYGRWLEDDYYGWVWVPGYEWSPAWVAWRDGGDYYGWAPLRPGINISINFNLGSYNPPHNYWCFVPRRHIASRGWYGHRVDYRQNVTIINQTTIINNYNYNRNVFRTGPRRSNVEIYTGRINPVRLRDASNPGRTVFRNNEVTVFRPQVRQDNNRQFAPRQVQRYEERNTAGRNSNNNSNGVFRRNAETTNRDNSPGEVRGNNLPRRQVERNANGNTQQQNNGNRNTERRVLNRSDRTANSDRPATSNTERRVFRSQEQAERRTQPGNTGNRRVLERKPENSNRQPQVRNQQAERPRNVIQQRQPQQRQPQQQRVEQPRRIERSSGNNQQRSGGNSNSNGRGNRRF